MPVIRAMARRLRRSRSIRRINCLVCSETGPFLGWATKRRLQPRQRKLGEPDWVLPSRTTWVEWHRGHGGIGSRVGVAVSIRRAYENPYDRATTPPLGGARHGAGAGDPRGPPGRDHPP